MYDIMCYPLKTDGKMLYVPTLCQIKTKLEKNMMIIQSNINTK